jgi:glycosyltransferase involved in cell wall biosynthesis
MIRVALVSHLSEISGGGIALLAMARGLDRARFDPVLILPGEGPIVARAREAGVQCVIADNPEESMAAASVIRKVRLLPGRISYVRSLARAFKTQGFDLVYVNTSLSVFPGIAAWLARKPIVWHVKETLTQPGAGTRAKMWMIERLASAVVYDSESGERAFPAARVGLKLVARNHVDVDRLAHAHPGPGLDDELGIRPGETVIVANGLFPRKGADVLLRAAGIVRKSVGRPLRFVLVGGVTPEHQTYFAELRELIARLGIGDCVSFAGVRDDMPEILKRSDILVSPSRNEAMPIVLTEAMAAGTPVVSTDVGDCRRLLEDGRLGILVPPDDPAAMAEALARILDAPGEAGERARLAQKVISDVYGSGHFWEPLEQLMLKVTDRW